MTKNKFLVVTDMFDYCFAENGLEVWKDGTLFAKKALIDEVPDEKLKPFINFVLKYLATEVDCPVKRYKNLENVDT